MIKFSTWSLTVPAQIVPEKLTVSENNDVQNKQIFIDITIFQYSENTEKYLQIKEKADL